MLVGPEGREQDQRALSGLDADLLKEELRLAAGSRDIVEVPERDQLALAELMTTAIDV